MLLLVLLGLLAAVRLASILRGQSFSPSSVLKALILVPASALVGVVLAEAGFFDKFISRFFDDKGSAETRAEMFELFRHIPFNELLLAPDASQLDTLRAHYGLDFGIESFWVSFALSYGLVASVVFFAALLAFSIDVVRRVRPGSLWVFAFFYGVASTSVSLSAKSPLLGVFTLLVLVLLRRPAAPRPAKPLPNGMGRLRRAYSCARRRRRKCPHAFAAVHANSTLRATSVLNTRQAFPIVPAPFRGQVLPPARQLLSGGSCVRDDRL